MSKYLKGRCPHIFYSGVQANVSGSDKISHPSAGLVCAENQPAVHESDDSPASYTGTLRSIRRVIDSNKNELNLTLARSY